jgi:hypothetical protein
MSRREFIREAIAASNLTPLSRTSPRAVAAEFIREKLKDGPIPALDIEQEALHAGLSKRTLARAKKDVGVISERPGGVGTKWVWSLPSKDAKIFHCLTHLSGG